ncbi:MAG: ABC transporter permease [Planctomycetota bacterium]|nr:ABC transporter permease [Planctomycetota bacterium]
MKPVPETVYSPASPLRDPIALLRKILRENWERRELCSQLFWRNIKTQYRQTMLGILWVFLPAIISALIWIFLHSFRVIRFSDAGEISQTAYILHVLTGMFLWQSFVEGYSAPIAAFQQNRNMMGKINFPREMIILVAICEVLFNAAVRCLILIPFVLFLTSGEGISAKTALFPVVFSALIFSGVTVGLLLVPLGALYLDVGKVLTMITPVWMIMTPIIYPTPTSFPANLLVYCNLASPTLITARDYLLGQAPQHEGICWLYVTLLVPLFLLAVVLYRISIPILLERSGNQ